LGPQGTTKKQRGNGGETDEWTDGVISEKSRKKSVAIVAKVEVSSRKKRELSFRLTEALVMGATPTLLGKQP
jgi:hypothetical protein